MSSNKKRGASNVGGYDSSIKKVNTGDCKPSEQPDFLSDGLDNKAICDIVQDIMVIIHENKGAVPHTVLVNNISGNDKFKFFIERYPML